MSTPHTSIAPPAHSHAPGVEQWFDTVSSAATRHPLLQRLTEWNRVALAVGFLAPGLVKLMGHRFTLLPIDTPVGAFFEALFHTGLYWRFIGGAQVLAALLLVLPWTQSLAAILFLPIILNIFVITIALDFGGTPVITGLMLLASVYLVCWEYPRWKLLMPWSTQAITLPPRPRLPRLERAGYVVAMVGGWVVTGVVRVAVPQAYFTTMAVIGVGLILASADGRDKLDSAGKGRAP